MRITILNGNPDTNKPRFDDYLEKLSNLLSRNHKVKVLQLRDMSIRYCIGCFGCWVKTPGECSNAVDDSRAVRREYINSDLVVFASPIKMGFTSATLKKAHDKLLPLLMPYSEVYKFEAHHVSRYDKYPMIALLLEEEDDTDKQDVKIISEIYRRDAINFKATFKFTKLTSDPIEEVANAIDSV